jgi:hypothetical protein
MTWCVVREQLHNPGILMRKMMKQTILITSVVAAVALLGGAAFVAGRLLNASPGTGGEGPMIHIGTGNGQVIKAEWVRAADLPAEDPDVAGAFARREDNSFFINETEGGFVLAQGEDGSLSVTNTTGKVSEVVVTGETLVLVDTTLDDMDASLVDGKCYQQVAPGSVEEIGELSFVRAWGEKRGDRLIASVLLYSRPPVISR